MPDPAPSPLPDWNAGIDQLPWRDPRAIGRMMLWLGAAAILAGMFLKPPPINVGLALGLAGALLARAPLHRLGAVIYAGVALVLWLAVSVAVARLRGQPHAGGLPGVCHAWLCLPVVAAAAQDPRWRGWALRGLVAVGALAAGVAVLQFCIGLDLESQPFKIGWNGQRFVVSRGFSESHLVLGFAGALLAALTTQPAPALGVNAGWAWASRCLGAMIFAVSGSRAALAGGVAGIGAGLASRGRRWLFTGVVIAVVLAGAALGRMALSDPGRMRAIFAGDDGRWAIWTTSMAMIREHPLFGMGGREAYMFAYNDTFVRVLPGHANEFADTDGCPHAHNWLLALAVEHGALAAILHLALVGAVLAACWRRRHDHPAGWTAAVAIATLGLTASLFEPYPTRAVPGAAFHACLGFALGLALTRSTTKEST